MAETIRRKVRFGEEEIEVIFRKTRTPVSVEAANASPAGFEDEENPEGKPRHRTGMGICPDLNRRTYLPESDVVCDQDVPVTLRDGTVIYADIYRPVGQSTLPCIVSWSYFGKRPFEGFDEWQIMGVPPGTVSRMAKFESADPGYWCRQGYAIANVDPRGTGHSEGDTNMFGTQDGRDGYDFVEWLATQHWSSGKVGFFSAIPGSPCLNGG